jgi:fermentation-respiration switch protein FrsA (DUF1100 family)
VTRFFCLAVALLSLFSGCVSVVSPLDWQRHAIFHPARYPAGDWQPTAVLVQDVWLTAKDGTRLHGWYVRHPEPKAHALVLHGNAGNVTVLAESLRLLNRRHGLAVLALDYRGFGRSEGKPSEEGILMDARAGRDWLAEKEGIDPTDVLLMGQSLGGAVAVDLAAKDGARGLVLASTFTSIPDLAQDRIWWLPMRMLMMIDLDSRKKIENYRGPLLITHGDADEVIPYEQGVELYEACPSQNKRMITVRGGKHNDPQPDEYRQALDQLIAELPPLKKGDSPPAPRTDTEWPATDNGSAKSE